MTFIRKTLLSVFVLNVCVFSLMTTVLSQEKATHSLYSIFYKTTTAHCYIEASAESESHVLRLQMMHHLAGVNCALSQQNTIALVSSMLEAHKEANSGASYNSLMIGDIENYMWIQHYLIESAQRNKVTTKKIEQPAFLKRNNYVSYALSSPAVINVFNLAGEKHGYRFSTINCEKVFTSKRVIPIHATCTIKMVQR